ncbi:MAG: FkbM family methyltransferase [Paracoccaceae bacterium]
MIKIDVEGMEMQVLAGFEATLRLHKPVLFVEVDRRNDTAFREWLAGSGYGVAETFSRYRASTNYLLQAGA